MHRLSILLLLLAVPAAAQSPALLPATEAPAATAQAPPVWTPASAYIAPGQDESGYGRWIAADPLRPRLVEGFENYLRHYQVGGVVPTWQLLRTATSWHRCGAQPFEIPPTAEWSHLVQTLRYVETHVVPVIGPVEVVSGYRNPVLNICAGGAPDSSHRHFAAIDMVPMRPIDRDGLIRSLCAIHAWRGQGYHVGLGFYAFHRFHVDTTRFRKWGVDGTPEASPCTSALADMHIAAVTEAAKAKPIEPATSAATVATPASGPPATPSAVAPAQTTPPAPSAVPEPAAR